MWKSTLDSPFSIVGAHFIYIYDGNPFIRLFIELYVIENNPIIICSLVKLYDLPVGIGPIPKMKWIVCCNPLNIEAGFVVFTGGGGVEVSIAFRGCGQPILVLDLLGDWHSFKAAFEDFADPASSEVHDFTGCPFADDIIRHSLF